MKQLKFINNKKGQAGGLGILLALIVTLFLIGLLVSIFALMGAELQSSDSLLKSETTTASQNAFVLSDAGVTMTACSTQTEGAIVSFTVLKLENGTATAIPTSNYSSSACILTIVGSSDYNGTSVNATYSFTHAGTSWETINETVLGIAGSIDFFDIFIVIGSMIVLILLTVIIIISIRGSGIMSGSESGRYGTSGSASA